MNATVKPAPAEMILLTGARLSFPNLVEPQVTIDPATNNKRVAYNCDLILEPTDPGFKRFMEVYATMATAKWPQQAQAIMQYINGDRKFRCYGWGQEKIDKKTMLPYGGYENMVYLSASHKDTPPQMILPDGTPMDPSNTMGIQQLARKLYAGCYVNAAVRPWLQENKHGRAVRCDLIAIQFAKDGVAFGEGTPDVTGLFGAVAGSAPAPAQSAPPMPGMPFPGAGAPTMPSSPGLPPFMTGG